MDEIETVSKTAQKLTFINHMTKFDDDTKSELLNITNLFDKCSQNGLLKKLGAFS